MNIFVWNYKRFLHTPIPTELFGTDPGASKDEFSYCVRALVWTMTTFGKKYILPANLTLFSVGFIFSLLDDYALLHTPSFSGHFLLLALSTLLLIAQYDVLKGCSYHNFIKLAYIIVSIGGSGYIFISYMFLAIYENMTALFIGGYF